MTRRCLMIWLTITATIAGCSGGNEAIVPDSEPANSTLTALSAPTTLEAATFRVDEHIVVDPGGGPTAVSNAVIRGERDRYIAQAEAGQTMTILVSSVETNAVAQVVGPDGSVLLEAAEEASFALPASGGYQIIIGSSRGNASYTLTLTIT
ncbi:MAG: hypothetical protein GY698_07130 [Actinomycetia bacterium]|nr:hypothetical protein [Actinomycetes bacterium]